MRQHFILIFLVCFGFIQASFAEGLPTDFVIQNKSYSFELLPMSDGKMTTGSAIGPKMIQESGSMENIFKSVWPEMLIRSEWGEKIYSLNLISAEQEIDTDFLNDVLENLIKTYPAHFAIGSKAIEFNCMKIENQSLLTQAEFNSKRGIEKLIAHNNNSVDIKGLNLLEIADWITKNSDYSFGFIGEENEVYELTINLTSARTIASSLKKIGITSTVCQGQAEELHLKK